MTKDDLEKQFKALEPNLDFGHGWEVRVERNGKGMPAIVVRSPKVDGPRHLVGNIEVPTKGMPTTGQVELAYFAGIEVVDATDFPKVPAQEPKPGWIDHVRVLQKCLEELGQQEDPPRISYHPAREGSDPERRKMPLVEHYLPQEKWLAKGHVDWALGARSEAWPLHDLRSKAEEFRRVIITWYEAEKNAQQS